MPFLHRQRGFTLIELSIVLIIIGLLIGGVVMTKSLIREAKLHSMLVEYDSYVKAIQEFRDKYQALPGDMTTATTSWGTAGACPNNVAATPPQIATCNGDGDGRIGTSDSDGNLSNGHEWWQAWQHLSNAGLIDGRYNGAYGPGGAADAVNGTNVPASKLEPGGWTLLYYLFTNPIAGSVWADRYGHIISFGSATTNTINKDPVLLPSEALSIDQKIDDGKPGMGNVRAWITANCVSGGAQTTATYRLDSTVPNQPACSSFFILGF